MMLEGIDVESLRAQINSDGVAIDQLGKTYPSLEPELIAAAQHGEATGFGKTAFVILDQIPGEVSTTRNIAQELLNTTSFDTVIVRAPAGGAVVSHDYSRAQLESAQYDFLANPQIAPAAIEFMDTLNGQFYPWAVINIVIAALVALAIAFVALSAVRAQLQLK